MKSFLLSIIYAASGGFIRWATEDIGDVCNANSKQITVIDYRISVSHFLKTPTPVSDKQVPACKEKTNNEVFVGVYVEEKDFETKQEKYFPKYDGINFDVSSFKSERGLETLLRGWREPGKLSLIIDGAKWPQFSEYLNKEASSFVSLYFKFKDIRELWRLFKDRTLKPVPNIPVYFNLGESDNLNHTLWIKQAFHWVKGIAYERYVKDDLFLYATDIN